MDCEKLLRDAYNDQRADGSPKRQIKLPSGLEFISEDSGLRIVMPVESATSNMQTDASAFESWALAFRSWVGVEHVTFAWHPPDDTTNKHYQRLLYRIAKFDAFVPWFRVDDPEHMEHSRAKAGREPLYLNRPDARRDDRESPKFIDLATASEDDIEVFLTHNPATRARLIQQFEMSSFDRQLPVGLFHAKVAEQNEIFPTRKSAIDAWGICRQRLLVFELKKNVESQKLGMLSELFFYTMVCRDLQNGIFRYEGEADETALKIAGTTEVISYLTTPYGNVHPLLQPKENDILSILNGTMAESGEPVSFCRLGIEQADGLLRFVGADRQV